MVNSVSAFNSLDGFATGVGEVEVEDRDRKNDEGKWSSAARWKTRKKTRKTGAARRAAGVGGGVGGGGRAGP